MDLKPTMKYLKIPRMRVLTVLLFVALCTPSVFAQRANIRAGNGMTETRDSVLRFHIDTVKIRNEIRDSILAHPGGADGRAYVRGLAVDSSGALYTVGYAMDWSTQQNFANSGAADSAQLVFSGSTGLLLPTFSNARRAYVERIMIKTNYTTSITKAIDQVFLSHTFGNTDTNMVSLHIVATGTSPRRYYLRLYKMKSEDVIGNAPALVAAYKTEVASVELDELQSGYFPPTATSFQFRATIRIRWLP